MDCIENFNEQVITELSNIVRYMNFYHHNGLIVEEEKKIKITITFGKQVVICII